MTIPQLPLVVAFAIGLPLGIAGYFIQEALIRRRRRRAHAAVEAGSGWGAHGTAPAAGTRSGRATAVTGAGPPTAVATPQTAPPVATPAAPPVPGEGPTAPPAEKGAAYSSRRAGALRKQEADLTDAVEVLVDFIEAPPRRARAEAAAAAVAALVPKARRGVELVAFLDGVAAGASPSASQGAAEAAGIELARALRAVKTELQEIEG